MFAGDSDAAVPLEDLQERVQDLMAAPEPVTFESEGVGSPQEPSARDDAGTGHLSAEDWGGGEDTPRTEAVLPFPGPDGKFRVMPIPTDAEHVPPRGFEPE